MTYSNADIISAYRAVIATGKYDDTTFQKHIPKGMSGSPWGDLYWRTLPKPRTQAVVEAAIAALGAAPAPPAPPAPPPAPAPPAPPAPAPVAPPPTPVTSSALLPPPTTALYATVGEHDPQVPGPGGVTWSLQQPPVPWAYTRSADGSVHQFTIRGGNHWWHDPAIKDRAELSGGPSVAITPNVGYAVDFDILVHAPGGFVNETVTFQIHDDHAITGAHPAVALRWTPGGVLKFTVSGSEAVPLLKVPDSVTLAAPKVVPTQDAWRHVRIEFRLGKAGYARFFFDGVLVASQAGAIGFAAAANPYYPKFGAYRAQGDAAGGHDLTVAYRNLVLKSAP